MGRMRDLEAGENEGFGGRGERGIARWAEDEGFRGRGRMKDLGMKHKRIKDKRMENKRMKDEIMKNKR